MIWVNASPGEHRVAVLVDGILTDYAIHRPGRPDGAGDVYRGRVIAHVPAMAGAFVALPEAEGFLPDSAGGAGCTEGMAVRVRVVRAAQGGKGPRLARDGPCDAGPPALLVRGPGAIERMAAAFPGTPIRIDDPALLAALRPTLPAEPGPRFSDELEAEIEALADPHLALPGGMHATLWPTPALVAIDVDGGAATAARTQKTTAQGAANRAAIPALARAIRLRNLSGAIVIDLAGMPARKRAGLAPLFVEALSTDPLSPRFLGFTALGLAEILRPRVHPPLHEVMAGPHVAGLAALRTIARDAAAAPAVAWSLVAAPDVCAALADDPVAQADLARRTGRPLVMRPDPSLPPGHTRIERMLRG